MENEIARVARKLRSLDWPTAADDEETLWRRRAALAIAAVNGDKEPPPADPTYFAPGDLECGCHGHEWACANRGVDGFAYDPGLGRFGLHRRLSKEPHDGAPTRSSTMPANFTAADYPVGDIK